MLIPAVLSGPLPKLGVIVVALLAAITIVAQTDRTRAWAMLGALVLAPVLLLDDIWSSPQLAVVHRHPAEAIVGAAVAVAVVCAAGTLAARRPRWFAIAAMAALPFRIPIETGGSTSNLLVPLYVVVAAGALGWLVPVLRSDAARVKRPAPHLYEQLLAGFVVLYALQATYSVDFEQGLQNMVFFYVPFALLLTLLRELRWDRELIVRCLIVVAGLGVVFACIGFVEEATKTLLLNPRLVAVNDVHDYFTVNSVFFDPDIFGRYLALVMILLVAALLYDRRPRTTVLVTVVLAVLWGGLVLTLSRSSLLALLVGMGALAALRGFWRPVLAAAVVVVVAGGIAIAVAPRTFGLNQGLNGASSGRANLVTGGLSMFGDRPVWGYGSGSFVTEYRRQNPGAQTAGATASHTIPVTIAAEQGLIGLIVYIALVLAALWTLLRLAGADPARAAVGAAFLALIVHTMLYADFLEDPLTWALLAVGGSLALRQRNALETARRLERSARRQAA